MARFAKLNIENKVEKVYHIDDDKITGIDGLVSDSLGVEYLNKTFGFHARWVRTYPKCEHRKNYAGINFKYDYSRDAFIPPKPYDSWTLNETSCLWEAPIAYPDDGQQYTWNEGTGTWDLITE